MLKSTHERRGDVRTKAYVLRRTNYGEADRILNLITPEGKVSAMAKGVRKEKSRLSGGIEMFSLIDVNIHYGKSELALITSSKMLKYYSNLLTDLARMELAAMILKKISLAAESSDNPEFFKIVDLTLPAINDGIPLSVVEVWFWFNYAKAIGEQVNLYRDDNGDKLSEGERYIWDRHGEVLAKSPNGNIGANEIKIMRLMLSADLSVVLRVKNLADSITAVLNVARALGKI